MKKLKLQKRKGCAGWYIRPTISGRTRWVYLADSKAEADRLARDYVIQLKIKEKRGINTEADINLAIEQYLKEKSQFLSTPKSRHKYFGVIKVFQRFIKGKPVCRVSDITREIVMEYLRKRSEEDNIAPATWNNERFVISNLFKYCVDEKWIEENPVKKIPKKRVPDTETEHLDGAGVNKLLEYEKSQKKRYTRICWYEIIATIVYTGMRVGEAVNLTKNDVDEENGFIRVGKSRGSEWTPKQKRSRQIPIPPPIRKIIMKQMNNPYELLFPNAEGRRIKQDRIREHLQKSCVELGIKVVTTHSLRHTFASEAISSGKPEAMVQAILGHKTAGMTKKYTHLRKEAIKDTFEDFKYE